MPFIMQLRQSTSAINDENSNCSKQPQRSTKKHRKVEAAGMTWYLLCFFVAHLLATSELLLKTELLYVFNDALL